MSDDTMIYADSDALTEDAQRLLAASIECVVDDGDDHSRVEVDAGEDDDIAVEVEGDRVEYDGEVELLVHLTVTLDRPGLYTPDDMLGYPDQFADLANPCETLEADLLGIVRDTFIDASDLALEYDSGDSLTDGSARYIATVADVRQPTADGGA